MAVAALTNYIAITLYLTVTFYLIVQITKQQGPQAVWVIVGTIAALIAHGYGVQAATFVDGGVNASIFKLPTLFFWVLNLIVLVSGLRKPLHNLFIFLFPLTILAILTAQYSGDQLTEVSPALGHITLAILASGFLTLATFQALILAFQNYQLKHRHPTGLVRLLPPLQTMESLMFELLWIGEVMLTLLIISGLVIIKDIFAQQQAHTLAFSLIAWTIYAVLLWGRFMKGWRGNTAIRWTLGGFAALMLAYVGTQLVYQVILN